MTSKRIEEKQTHAIVKLALNTNVNRVGAKRVADSRVRTRYNAVTRNAFCTNPIKADTEKPHAHHDPKIMKKETRSATIGVVLCLWSGFVSADR